MSGFSDEHLGIASSIFLVIYFIYFLVVLFILFRLRGLWNRYTTLFIFSIFRLVGQISGICFAYYGLKKWQWLIVYLVFSAEGYFTLILATFYFLVEEQKRYFGHSELDAKVLFGGNLSYKWIFHYLLIPANALVVAGGSILAGMTQEDVESDPTKVHKSKVMRTVGQALFLALSGLALSLNFYYYFFRKLKSAVLIPLMVSTPFIILRGILGVLMIYIKEMDYYSLSNYEGSGLKASFVIYEYTMGVAMECITAWLLVSTFFIKVDYPHDQDPQQDSVEKISQKSVTS